MEESSGVKAANAYNEDGVQGLLVILNKADRCRHLFNLLLEQLGLSPQSSRKDFFDAMLSLHEDGEKAAMAMSKITAREAMAGGQARRKTPKKEGGVS